MAEKSNGEIYDKEELENIAHLLQVSGLTKKVKRGAFLKTDSGTSMNPTIRAGDTILWTEIENMADLKVGDIIVFKNPIRDDNYITHRIVGILEALGKGKFLFLTKGDNLPNRDRFAIPQETVIGVVVGVIYKTRWGSAKNGETR